MVKGMEKTPKKKSVATPHQQALGFPSAKRGEYVNAICAKCGNSFAVLVNWEYRNRPLHFYCSGDCYSASLSGRSVSKD